MTAFQSPNYPRIVCDPGVLGGKPCIKGTRLSIQFIMELLATGSREEVVLKYPQLTLADVQEAIRYAGDAASRTTTFDRRIAG